MSRISVPNAPISSENIDRPAISRAADCISCKRERSIAAPAKRRSPAQRLQCGGPAFEITRGAIAGAMVRRWCRQLSPSMSSTPYPVIGRRMRMTADVRR